MVNASHYIILKLAFVKMHFFGKIFKLKMTINSERPFKRFMFHKMCTFSWQLSHYSSKFKGDLTVCISHTENNSYMYISIINL